MNQRSSAPARTIAVAALVCGFLVVVVIVATSLGGGDSGGSDGRSRAGKAAKNGRAGDGKEAPKAYVVQNGDTLTSIAHRTGVSVARIQELNPGVDPQILVSGEKLKLR
jgi:LysM repeat protein